MQSLPIPEKHKLPFLAVLFHCLADDFDGVRASRALGVGTTTNSVRLRPEQSVSCGATDGSSITDAGSTEGPAIIAPAELPA